jgi:hypothetical protein
VRVNVRLTKVIVTESYIKIDNIFIKIEFLVSFPIFITVSDQMFVVSRFEPYTMGEKALMPFDAEVWYWLIGFVGFGVVVILVVSFMRRPIRDFIFGRNVRAPLLNLM